MITTTNEPVLTHGTATAIAAALTPVLVAAGIQSDSAGRLGSLIGAGAVFVLGLVSLFAARRKVTPVSSPDGGTGARLVTEIAQAAVDGALARMRTETLGPAPAPTAVPSTVLAGVVEQPAVGGAVTAPAIGDATVEPTPGT